MQVVAQNTIHIIRPPSKQNQTDFIIYENLRRFETILVFSCQIVIDTFMGRNGKLSIDSELLSVCFVYEEKVNFQKFFQVGEVRTSYEKQNKSTHYH